MAQQPRLICASAQLKNAATGVRFEVEIGGTSVPAFVIRYHNKIHAYLNRCAHIPIEMDWQPGDFFDFSGLYLVCATHGALYLPETGQCASGRCAGKGLTAVSVQEHDGNIYLTEEIHHV
jgi:nitrite reductase/ring-hydroxylating ferredoxin subunit